jgi:ribosome-binding protein aMBF1 (putative translation factor)
MLKVEDQLGHTLEEDYQEYYVRQGWGQKKLAQRWGVGRNLIFKTSIREGRRSWTTMLGLPVRGERTADVETSPRPKCELCGEDKIRLDGAHWVPRSEGGSDESYNKLAVCPNCHRLLDDGDQEKQALAKATLVWRVVSQAHQRPTSVPEARLRLLDLVTAIINRKPI